MVWRVQPAHKRLQTRMEHMRRFRRQHEQLRTVIVRVLRPSGKGENAITQGEEGNTPNKEFLSLEANDASAIEVCYTAHQNNYRLYNKLYQEVNIAYENVKEVDCLDISREGNEAWEAAVRRYEERIDRVEARITARLRDQLGTAKNANEMFRIFSRFNALFVRPHIRGAIREYQTQLIQRVKDDIEALHEKFKVNHFTKLHNWF
jgi:dynein heavy chain 1, cytosolic